MVIVGVHRDPRHPGLHLLHPGDLLLLLRLPPPPLYEPDQPPCPPAPLPPVLLCLLHSVLAAAAGQVGRLVPRVDQAAVVLHWRRGLTETASEYAHVM